MRRFLMAVAIAGVAVLVSSFIYAQSPTAFWRTPDSSVRMARQVAEANGEKTRSAAQTEAAKPVFHSVPEPPSITAEQVVFFCVLITAVAAAVTRFIVQPANTARDLIAAETLNNKLTEFRAAIDRDFLRTPNHEEDRAISRGQNAALEEKARLEHQLLAERITALTNKVDDQGRRIDIEFGKVWKVCQRFIDRLDGFERRPKVEQIDE